MKAMAITAEHVCNEGTIAADNILRIRATHLENKGGVIVMRNPQQTFYLGAKTLLNHEHGAILSFGDLMLAQSFKGAQPVGAMDRLTNCSAQIVADGHMDVQVKDFVVLAKGTAKYHDQM